MSGGLTLLLVAVGGALGAIARYLLGRAVQRRAGGAFPAGTLAVNLLGCLLLGLTLALLDGRVHAQQVTAFVAVGFLGDFTTYSTYSQDAVRLGRGGRGGTAAAYLFGSIALGLIAVALGFMIGAAAA